MQEIFRTVVGSRLYGLSTEKSDTDIKGFALPSKNDLLGLEDTARKHWEFENDTVIYSVTKFINLLIKGNPTVTELLFVPEGSEAILKETPEARKIRAFGREHLVTKKILPSYFGYVKEQFERVKSRKAQNNRTEMIEKWGFDVKCASHVYRLAVQACELMTTGKCNPTMTGMDRDIALQMKLGRFNYENVLATLQIAMEGMKQAESVCKLPEAPDMRLVNDFVVDLHQRVIVGQIDE